MTINAPGDLQVPARREGAGEVEGFGEQGDAHGEVKIWQIFKEKLSFLKHRFSHSFGYI